MALADRYLYDGEHIVTMLPVSGFLDERELAGTTTRVICTQSGKFYDVEYESLSSIGCGPIYEPGWALASFVLTALAIAFAWSASLMPRSLPVGPFSIGLGRLASLIGFPAVVCGGFAMAAVVIFLFTARQGIVMRTPGGTFVFGYGRGQDDLAIAFVKAVRAACDHRSKEHLNPGEPGK